MGEIFPCLRRLLCCGSLGIAAILCLVTAPLGAEWGVAVKNIRLSYSSDSTRVVLDLSGPVEHRLFSLHDPERVVIDLENAKLAELAQHAELGASAILAIRHAARDGTDLRVVLDLQNSATLKSFLLPPVGGYDHRLVVDLYHPGAHVSTPATPVPPPTSAPTPVIVADDDAASLRDVVVAIDAGHGGEDPGAVGPYGTYEKDVVLSIARRLEELIQAEPGMRPVMIRDSDIYLELRDRIARARAHEADLFISIHADAALSSYASGSSVYVLSRTGASSEAARWLAERENAADLMGGVRLNDKDDTLARVLMDLSQTATIEASMTLAEDVLGELELVGDIHSSSVEQAGFAVLTSPDIPSVLVETAYISNSEEEQRLRTSAYQEQVALAMLNGLRVYFSDHSPPGTLYASDLRDRHVIRYGDTLSTIAQHYSVNVDALRARNSLNGDVLRVGQVLLIPTSDG
ncbi:MAG: N-acetylmuramoyl-L-alanine amidase [Gammaproteobacteria bacterium]